MTFPGLKTVGWWCLLCAIGLAALCRQAGAQAINTRDGEYEIYKKSEALVIGVSDYVEWKDLNVVRDEVRDVSAALTEMGFTTKVVRDPSSDQLVRELKKFLMRNVGRDTRLIVFFAGHGWTDNQRNGFILPRDIPIDEQSDDFLSRAVSMSEVRAMTDSTDAKHVLLVFDSCFSGSIFLVRSNLRPSQLFVRDADRKVHQFITSGSENEQVPDATDFYKAFIEGLKGQADTFKDGVVTANELGAWLKAQVTQIGAQTPQYGTDPRFDYRLGDMLFPLSTEGMLVDVAAAPVVEPVAEVGPFKSLVRGQGLPEDPRANLFTGLDIIYYRKLADGSKVEDALNKRNIPYSATGAELPEKFSTNTLGCAPDVPIEALKKLALTLIDGGVGLQSIRTFQRPADKRRRIEIFSTTKNGSGVIPLDTAPLTREQINQLTSCPRLLLNKA